MNFQIKEPVLVVGLGGAGSRLAIQAGSRLGADVLLISNDSKDLHEADSIMVSTAPVVNPTVGLIRGAAYQMYGDMADKISQYPTILVMANLAGKAGTALAPVIVQMCQEAQKDAISFAIMPFRYEKERIFDSGVTLKRLRENSRFTIILDNDALLESNPNLSPNTCFDIANKAILHVVGSLADTSIDSKTGMITVGTSQDVEESLRDSLKMLYAGASPDSVKHSILYVAGKDDVPVGILDSISRIADGVFNDGHVEIETAESNFVMLSALSNTVKFDGYDPLGTIPRENTLDWDAPKVSIDCKLDMYQLE